MICNKEDCTGCFACYNACPQNCIDMVEDELGYIYPMIDESKCTNCGLCKKVCINHNDIEFYMPEEAFAIWNKNQNIRKTSTSGGAATTFSKYVLNNSGVVYGAAYKGNGIVEHIRVDSEADLYKLQGSKYVHSYVKNSFKEVKRDLLSNRPVIFFGTPCQIAGLKLFLKREYSKLYLVDLICHGVSSQKFLADEINYLVGDKSIDAISFRGTDGFKFKMYYDNKLVKEVLMGHSLYYIGFMHSITYRENCYHCKFAQPKRCSDITIGDFWGIGEENECNYKQDSNLGISAVLPITSKGKNLLENVKEDIFLDRRTVSEAINGNDQLRRPSMRHKNVNMFRKQYSKVGFQNAVKKSIYTDIIKQKIKNILKKNKLLYRVVMNIRNKETMS